MFSNRKMDTVDAPMYGAVTKKQRSELPQTSLQQELRQKMRQRKMQGLTADVTSEESEDVDDGIDSEEENSWTRQYRANQKQRADRPTSAKRREKPELGETMRASDANTWLKSSQGGKKDGMSSLRQTPPLKESPRFSKQQSEVDKMFGTLGGSSPKSRTSPLDRKFGMGSGDAGDSYSPKSRQSPTSSLPKSIGGKQSPGPSQRNMESAIFGDRKTPTNESGPDKEWKAPSFRRSTGGSPDRTSPIPESSMKGGRKTPVDTGLLPINESPRPVPRSRQHTSPKESRFKSRDASPRNLSMESPRSERSKHKVELFGKKERQFDLDEEEQERSRNSSARARRGYMKEDKKTTLPKQGSYTGRKTPTGRETPTGTGRKSPSYGSGPSGRQTPTNKQTKFDLKGTRAEENKPKKEAGLFDFLAGDTAEDKAKAKQRKDREKSFEREKQYDGSRDRYEKSYDQDRSFDRDSRQYANEKYDRDRSFDRDSRKYSNEKHDRDRSFDRERSTYGNRHSNLKKSVSQDSITEELGVQPSMLEKSSHDEGKIPMDQSSVCFEVDQDPDKARQRHKEREKQLTSPSKQRSDRREADNIIGLVEDAQSDPKQLTKDRPASAKTHDKVARPKPRHTLPGTRPTSAMHDDDYFNSTASIRDTIFEEWRKTKNKEIKQKTAEQKKKETEAEKKKLKEEEDKKLESKASYNAWMKTKGDTFVKEKQKQKRDEEQKQREKEREELQKKKEAMKNFKKWKEDKDDRLIEEHKKKIEIKHRQKQAERENKKDKEKTNSTAFRGWKERKDVKLKDTYKQQQENLHQTKKMEEQTQKQKERQALKDYNEWLVKKEKQEKREALRQRHRSDDDDYYDDFKPAWSPASKLIPCGR